MLRKQNWIHPLGYVTAVSYCTILAVLQIWKSSGWFVLVNVISAQNERCFLHLVVCFPLFKGKLWWAIWCSSYWNRELYMLANLLAFLHQCQSGTSTSFSKSLKATQNALHGRVMLCWGSPWSKGRFMGPHFPAELYSSHLNLWDTSQSCFVWMKERQYSSDRSSKFISLAWGVLVFTRSASDKFVFGKKVCVFVPFSVSKGRKAKDLLETIKHFSLVSCLD